MGFQLMGIRAGRMAGNRGAVPMSLIEDNRTPTLLVGERRLLGRPFENAFRLGADMPLWVALVATAWGELYQWEWSQTNFIRNLLRRSCVLGKTEPKHEKMNDQPTTVYEDTIVLEMIWTS